MADFRVDTSFFRHIKTKRLKRQLGLDGVFALLKLWAYATDCRHDSDRIYTAEDIAFAVDWETCEVELVDNLVDSGFLDPTRGGYRIHNWGAQ